LSKGRGFVNRYKFNHEERKVLLKDKNLAEQKKRFSHKEMEILLKGIGLIRKN
jgi:hypothetical protein